MRNATKLAIFGAIITLIAPFVWQIFSLPDPVWNASSGTDNICQKKLDFSNEVSELSFSYSNLGKDKGNFEGTVSSNDVLLKYTNSNQEFAFKNSKVWVAEINKPINFQFDLRLSENMEEPETIGIQIDLTCNKLILFDKIPIPCGWESYTCNYQNQHIANFGPDYELIK